MHIFGKKKNIGGRLFNGKATKDEKHLKLEAGPSKPAPPPQSPEVHFSLLVAVSWLSMQNFRAALKNVEQAFQNGSFSILCFMIFSFIFNMPFLPYLHFCAFSYAILRGHRKILLTQGFELCTSLAEFNCSVKWISTTGVLGSKPVTSKLFFQKHLQF